MIVGVVPTPPSTVIAPAAPVAVTADGTTTASAAAVALPAAPLACTPAIITVVR